MSLTTIMSTASSGLMAAQTGLRTVSDNIANVNTPGYVRKVVNQVSLVTLGSGQGVDVLGIRRVVDQYLQSASLSAAGRSGGSGVLAELLDRVQGLFGDPSLPTSFFGGLDEAYTEFSALANDPSSSLQRGEAINSLQTFFDEAARITASMTSMKQEADTRIRADVDRVNGLLSEISKLNGDISRAKIGGADSSGSENIQAQLINELAELMNFQLAPRSQGGVTLRTADGMMLAGENSATLTYNRSDTAAGFLTIIPADGGGQAFEAKITGGEIYGLLEMRDRHIPSTLAQLTEFVSRTADELNRAHNAHSAVPAPATLAGRNTGLDLPTAVSGFTGVTTVAVVNAAGAVQRTVQIDFTGGGISVDGGASTAFTPANFLTSLNTALGAMGSASFTGGALTLNAASGGIAIADDPAAPSSKAGQGFSQFFGLNDLVHTSSFAPFETGLAGTDPHGFTAGQTMTMRLSDPDGGRIRDVTFTVPAGSTMNDLVSALNAPVTGVAPYGSFALNANGRLAFTPSASSNASLTVVTDATARGAGGPPMSAFFGIGPAARAAAAATFVVNPAINLDPMKLALAKLNLGALAGTPALAIGDGRGGFALSQSGENLVSFGAAGDFAASTMSVSRYATEFAGLLGRKSAASETQMLSADAVRAEADNRRSSFEGVNMDEELVRLTTYQQAFNASARMIQAANDLYDVLLDMV